MLCSTTPLGAWFDHTHYIMCLKQNIMELFCAKSVQEFILHGKAVILRKLGWVKIVVIELSYVLGSRLWHFCCGVMLVDIPCDGSYQFL